VLPRLFIPLLFPYESKVEANEKEHRVDDAPQSQQFWGNTKSKKRNSQVSKIEICVYPSANKKRTGEKFTDLFPINAHNSNDPSISTYIGSGRQRRRLNRPLLWSADAKGQGEELGRDPCRAKTGLRGCGSTVRRKRFFDQSRKRMISPRFSEFMLEATAGVEG
jgi:hypothetical protein